MVNIFAWILALIFGTLNIVLSVLLVPFVLVALLFKSYSEARQERRFAEAVEALLRNQR